MSKEFGMAGLAMTGRLVIGMVVALGLTAPAAADGKDADKAGTALALVLETTPTAAGTDVEGSLAAAAAEIPIEVDTLSGAYLAGSFAVSQNDLASASAFMAAALRQVPDDVTLLHDTFHLLVRSGRISQAVVLARHIDASDPAERMAPMVLALEAMRTGDYGTALERIAALREADGDNPVLPLLEAWARAGDGDRDGAIDLLTTAGEDTGFGRLSDLARAMVLDMSGDLEAARDAYEMVAEAGDSLRLVQALGSVYERLGADEAGGGAVRAPMPGLVLDVLVADRPDEPLGLRPGRVTPLGEPRRADRRRFGLTRRKKSVRLMTLPARNGGC